MASKILLTLIFLFTFSAKSALATTYYIAPDKDLDGSSPNVVGNDNYPGTLSQPIKTFSKAWQLLQPGNTTKPGDTLLLMDGIYLQTMAPNARDGAPNPVVTSGDNPTTGALNPLYPLDHPERVKNYITVKAQNDGKAIIDGENVRPVVQLGYYTQDWKGHYYILEGLVARNSRGSVYLVTSRNVIIRRCSGINAYAYDNDHIFTVSSGGTLAAPANILLEDNFATGTGRKMLFAYGTYVNVIFRRNVGYWMGHYGGNTYCGNDWPNGDNIEMYNWSQPTNASLNSIYENNIALGGTPTYGFNLTPNPARTLNNKFLGNISMNAGRNIDGTVRTWSCSNWPAVCSAMSGKKCAAADWSSSDWQVHRSGFTVGVYGNPYMKNNVFQDNFAYGNASVGLAAGGGWCTGSEPAGTYPCAKCNPVEVNPSDNCASGEVSPSDRSGGNVLTRMTLVNNSVGIPYPATGQETEVLQSSLDTFSTFGTLGSLFVEGDSIYTKQADGARLRYRYVNGEITTQELWPWPMEERIKADLARELGINNYSVTNSVVQLINQYTAVSVPLNSVPGDLNGDGKVDILDLRFAIKNFSSVFELTTVLANYGK